MATLSEIQEKVNKLQTAINHTEHYRKQWSLETKPLLIRVFKEVIDAVKFSWGTYQNETRENDEWVCLHLHRRPSGISMKAGEGVYQFIMEPGYLFFMQIPDGEVAVLITYPSIENILSKKAQLLVGIYKPEMITEEFIIDKVGIFLDEMTTWHNGSEGVLAINSIGFTIPARTDKH